jgi:hypothetical protein
MYLTLLARVASAEPIWPRHGGETVASSLARLVNGSKAARLIRNTYKRGA